MQNKTDLRGQTPQGETPEQFAAWAAAWEYIELCKAGAPKDDSRLARLYQEWLEAASKEVNNGTGD